jgi:GDPmannose 4,6-dehydratase
VKWLKLLAVTIHYISWNLVAVRVDPEYYRPTEVDLLIGDPNLRRNTIGLGNLNDLAS